MKVKRFVDKTMQLALRQVTQQLGHDAVIISSKKLGDQIEVMAALNYQPGDETRQADEMQRQMQLQRELDAVKQANQSSADRVAYASRTDMSNPAAVKSMLTELKQGRVIPASKTSPGRSPNRSSVVTDGSISSASSSASMSGFYGGQPLVDSAPSEHMADASLDSTDESLISERRDDGVYQTRLTEMQDELKELKNWMVSHQGSAWDTERPLTWKQSQWWQRCQDMGIESVWADRIASQLDDDQEMTDGWQQALKNIAADLPIRPPGMMEKGGRFALVGPTGAGKTTTIGKLAAQFAMRHGADSVAVITLDNYRVAAHDQLRAFVRILGIGMHTVNQPEDMQRALKQTAKKRLVLVDSAGLSSQDPQFDCQLSMLKATDSTLQKLLVLPLTSQARCLQENFEQFKAAGLHGCVFSKLDECFSLGPGMSVAALGRLPICLVTDGPHIPDDIHYPDASRLVNLAEQMARMAKTRWQAAAAMSMATAQSGFHHGV